MNIKSAQRMEMILIIVFLVGIAFLGIIGMQNRMKEKDADKSNSNSNKVSNEVKEKELIGNEVEKMYALWELGLDLSQPLKNYTIDKLTKKLDKTPGPLKPAVNKQINE